MAIFNSYVSLLEGRGYICSSFFPEGYLRLAMRLAMLQLHPAAGRADQEREEGVGRPAPGRDGPELATNLTD